VKHRRHRRKLPIPAAWPSSGEDLPVLDPAAPPPYAGHGHVSVIIPGVDPTATSYATAGSAPGLPAGALAADIQPRTLDGGDRAADGDGD
jgi:hypothetical protein